MHRLWPKSHPWLKKIKHAFSVLEKFSCYTIKGMPSAQRPQRKKIIFPCHYSNRKDIGIKDVKNDLN